MRERMKAQDVFNKTEFVFGKKTTFSEAFPEVKNITLEIEEDGKKPTYYSHLPDASVKKRVYRKDNFPGEFVNCSNPLCYNGGVRIGLIIDSMTSSKDTKYEKVFFCQGYEGSPKGRKRYRDCINRFKVKITIEYAPETDPAD